jgi:Tol biopolymer transport system component
MAFACEAGGQWDLFAWDPFGARPPRRLTSTPLDELKPSLAPDRSRVVYADSGGHLWALELAGGEPRRLTEDGEDNLFLQPAAAPGGRSVMAARRYERSQDDTDLAIRELPGAAGDDPEAEPPVYGPAWETLAGDRPTRVLPMVSSQFSPAWAPDGRRFAFTNLHARWTGSIVSEIWEARVDHSYVRQLTLIGAFCDEPAFSPSGTEVAFSCDHPDQYEIYAVDVRSREVRRLTEHPASDQDPVYSPDGRFVAFVSTRSGHPAIHLLDLGAGTISELRPFSGEPHACRAPDWR